LKRLAPKVFVVNNLRAGVDIHRGGPPLQAPDLLRRAPQTTIDVDAFIIEVRARASIEYNDFVLGVSLGKASFLVRLKITMRGEKRLLILKDRKACY